MGLGEVRWQSTRVAWVTPEVQCLLLCLEQHTRRGSGRSCALQQTAAKPWLVTKIPEQGGGGRLEVTSNDRSRQQAS